MVLVFFAAGRERREENPCFEGKKRGGEATGIRTLCVRGLACASLGKLASLDGYLFTTRRGWQRMWNGLGFLCLCEKRPEDVEWGLGFFISVVRNQRMWNGVGLLFGGGLVSLDAGRGEAGDYTLDFCGNVLAFRERCDIFFSYRST
ncbi:MAG: hypothetical protein IKQ16_07165 [Lentisphaeria bacterium]|nr:hypothetical protein [Lentisphaeria bacterium]